MKTALLLATMPAAAAFSIKQHAVKPMKKKNAASESPLFQPPRMESTRLHLRRRNRDTKYKLQAYTVAPSEESTNNPWYNFLNFRDSVADYADSLFSLEGGATPAARPYFPNLDVEEQLVTSAAAASSATVITSAVTTTTDTEELDKHELMMELNALSETFDDLQSRYEATIDTLKDENSFLEEGIKMLTVTIEEQAEQIELLQKQQSEVVVVEAESDLDGIGAIFENKVGAVDDATEELAQVQNKVAALEEDNEMLRQRVRGLEVELSDVAFESRKIVAAAAVEAPAAPVAAMEVVAEPIAEVNAISTDDGEEEVAEVVVEQVKAVALSPHAPSAPVPQHILQKQEMEMLRMQVKEYEAERSSVRKLFARGIRRGVTKVGKVLDLWRPIYLILCDGVRGDGKMAL